MSKNLKWDSLIIPRYVIKFVIPSKENDEQLSLILSISILLL